MSSIGGLSGMHSSAVSEALAPQVPPTKTSAPNGSLAKKEAEALQAAKDFETLFVDMLLKGMRQTAMPEDPSNALDIYTGMLDSEYSKNITETQSLGIRDLVLDWMKQSDPELGKALSSAAGKRGLDEYRTAKIGTQTNQ